MVKVIAVTEAIKSLADVEARFGLSRSFDVARSDQRTYAFSRVYSLYAVPEDAIAAVQLLKFLGQQLIVHPTQS
ncbi:MAG: hypothetical protein AAFQ74_12475 [Cyanobacteria bacterium J06623_4]